jgi:hypothetical protein
MTCRHLGRIDKELPCPELRCHDAVPGRALVVPIELDELSFITIALKRVVFVDRLLGRYVRWDAVEGPVHRQ